MRTTIAAVAGALLATLGMAAVQTRTASQVPAAMPAMWQGQPALVANPYAAGAPYAAGVPAGYVPGPAYGYGPGAVTAYVPGAPVARPVGYGDIVEYQPRARAATYVRQEPVRRRVVRTAPKRSWQKSALVIGGSAGAGAGIGALAGGKKGALIGAAIGGGAGSIFEAFKRR